MKTVNTESSECSEFETPIQSMPRTQRCSLSPPPLQQVAPRPVSYQSVVTPKFFSIAFSLERQDEMRRTTADNSSSLAQDPVFHPNTRQNDEAPSSDMLEDMDEEDLEVANLTRSFTASEEYRNPSFEVNEHTRNRQNAITATNNVGRTCPPRPGNLPLIPDSFSTPSRFRLAPRIRRSDDDRSETS